ncbi:MAG: GNAT family N-acetyltransferase [Longispora sp.]|nr:GNAT family N-acetyltransferase [Longispora sp. (in: high G+C Gram-positive bacteria)]
MATLRPLRESDVDDLVAASNDSLIQLYVPSLPAPYTSDHALWWITRGVPEVVDKGGFVWAIADPASDRLLGSVGLNPMFAGGAGRHSAALGFWVAPWARQRGLATDVTRQVTAWAFEQGFPRLELGTRPENALSQRVALAAGYRSEGIRQAAERCRGGGWRDLLIWSRLPGDPPGPTPRLIPDAPVGGLSDGVVTLRPLSPGDTDDLFALRTLPEVVASHVPSVTPSLESIERECALASAAWLAGSRVTMVIIEVSSGAFAGEIGLYYQEPITGQAMVGYATVPTLRGRGHMTRAVNLLSEWAFSQVGVHRLIAGTHPDNGGSQRVLAKSGFVREGLQRSRLPGPGGNRIDDVLWARLPD